MVVRLSKNDCSNIRSSISGSFIKSVRVASTVHLSGVKGKCARTFLPAQRFTNLLSRAGK